MKQIKEKLNHIQKQRHLRRHHRHHSGYYLVSLAGYTNAGKSSLLNELTNEEIDVEDRLFSTLSTTTRKLSQSSIPILMTDTVGFIQRLPAWIIDAFHSTLEEIKDADVVVLVVDASDSFTVFQQKVRTSFDELADLGVTSPVLVALNKIDLVSKEQVEVKEQFVNAYCSGKKVDVLPISIVKKYHLVDFVKRIHAMLPQLYQLEIVLPNTEKTQSFLSWIYDYGQLEDIVYGEKVKILVTTHEQIKDKIISKVDVLKGNVTSIKQK